MKSNKICTILIKNATKNFLNFHEWGNIPGSCIGRHAILFYYYYFLNGCTHSIRKFPGQVLNLSTTAT